MFNVTLDGNPAILPIRECVFARGLEWDRYIISGQRFDMKLKEMPYFIQIIDVNVEYCDIVFLQNSLVQDKCPCKISLSTGKKSCVRHGNSTPLITL